MWYLVFISDSAIDVIKNGDNTNYVLYCEGEKNIEKKNKKRPWRQLYYLHTSSPVLIIDLFRNRLTKVWTSCSMGRPNIVPKLACAALMSVTMQATTQFWRRD